MLTQSLLNGRERQKAARTRRLGLKLEVAADLWRLDGRWLVWPWEQETWALGAPTSTRLQDSLAWQRAPPLPPPPAPAVPPHQPRLWEAVQKLI